MSDCIYDAEGLARLESELYSKALSIMAQVSKADTQLNKCVVFVFNNVNQLKAFMEAIECEYTRVCDYDINFTTSPCNIEAAVAKSKSMNRPECAVSLLDRPKKKKAEPKPTSLTEEIAMRKGHMFEQNRSFNKLIVQYGSPASAAAFLEQNGLDGSNVFVDGVAFAGKLGIDLVEYSTLDVKIRVDKDYANLT